MSQVYEDLKGLESALENVGYQIDHYEIRPDHDFSASPIRISGANPVKLLEEWENSDYQSSDYVIEVFIDDGAPLDRLIYDSETGETEYIPFSGTKDKSKVEEINALLEE